MPDTLVDALYEQIDALKYQLKERDKTISLMNDELRKLRNRIIEIDQELKQQNLFIGNTA